ncbi:hypothetical protein AQ918_19505 [Burkholderia pseudomallei]|nr:hypothetical protein AQ918_19505 [Burkholderia pseudomallei]
MFGRFGGRRAAKEREAGKRVVRDFGEIFCYQAREGLAALGTVTTIARSARAVALQDMLRAATASKGRSETAFASSDP